MSVPKTHYEDFGHGVWLGLLGSGLLDSYKVSAINHYKTAAMIKEDELREQKQQQEIIKWNNILSTYNVTQVNDESIGEALRNAVANNALEDVKLILQKYPKLVNQQGTKNEGQKAPLHISAERNLLECTKILLEYKAEWSIRDTAGNTAYDYAKGDVKAEIQKRIDMDTYLFTAPRRGYGNY